MIKVAFDVDGTLIQASDNSPRYSVLQMMFLLKTYGCYIYVWSGGGVEYAKRWTEKLGIAEMVMVIPKGSVEVDICFDDQDAELAKVNIKV